MGMVNSTCRCSSRLFFPALACTTLKLEAGEGESLMLLRGEAPLEGGGGGGGGGKGGAGGGERGGGGGGGGGGRRGGGGGGGGMALNWASGVCQDALSIPQESTTDVYHM